MAMTLLLATIWVVAACVAGMAPRRHHWAAAWVLIAAGIPILGLVTLGLGPVGGLIGLVGGVMILRWPILREGQRLVGVLAPPQKREHPGE